jgi:hypothetical protein
MNLFRIVAGSPSLTGTAGRASKPFGTNLFHGTGRVTAGPGIAYAQSRNESHANSPDRRNGTRHLRVSDMLYKRLEQSS